MKGRMKDREVERMEKRKSMEEKLGVNLRVKCWGKKLGVKVLGQNWG